MRRWKSDVARVWCVVALLGSCRDEPPEPAPIEAPPLHDPRSHVPLPVQAPPRARAVLSPAPLPPVAAPRIPPEPVAEVAPEPPPPVVDDLDTQTERWLAAANAVEPGCLIEGVDPPDLPLPSPPVLARILAGQPSEFAGVAREALACVLDLQRVMGARVSGQTVFKPQAAAAEVRLAGGERPLGVLVFAAEADEPPSDETVILALDRRDDAWIVRAALSLPWSGHPESRRIESLRAIGVLSSKRDALVVRQGDREGTVEEIVGLTPTDELTLALATTVALDDPSGVKTTATVVARGKSWPRELAHRAVIATKDATRRWRTTLYTARPGQPYAESHAAEGEATLEGAAVALEAGLAEDVGWIVGLLSREQRASSGAWAVRARAAVARGRLAAAEKAWRRAAEAKGAPPEAMRDYGLFLIERRKGKRALTALKAYLTRRPDAPDRADVEARVDALAGRRE